MNSDEDFTGDFAMTGGRRAVRVTDKDMPRGVRAQAGMGDLEEAFREVTHGLDDMHRRVLDPQDDDPMTSFSTRGYYDDVQQDADEAAESAIDVDEGAFAADFDGSNPVASVAEIDPEIEDIACDDFERGEL